jgi:hypothetical protein
VPGNEQPSAPVSLALGTETTLLRGERANAGDTSLVLAEILDGSVRLSVDGEDTPLGRAEALPIGEDELVLLWADATVGAARFDFRTPAPSAATMSARGRGTRGRGMTTTMATSMTGSETAPTMSAAASDFSAGVFEGRMRALPVQDL